MALRTSTTHRTPRCVPASQGSSLIPSSLPLAQVWPMKHAQGESLQHSTELVMAGDPSCWHQSCCRQKTEGLSFPPSFVVPWGKGDGLDGEHGAQGMGCA